MADAREIVRALTGLKGKLFRPGWEGALASLGLRPNSAEETHRAFDWKGVADVGVGLDRKGCPERVVVTLASFAHTDGLSDPEARLEEEFRKILEAATAELGEPDFRGRADEEENPFEMASGAEWVAVWDSDLLLVMLEAESSHGDPDGVWEISLAVEPALPEN